ncbi:MAG: copper resistance protein CopC [Nocardioidaceae bacterium]
MRRLAAAVLAALVLVLGVVGPAAAHTEVTRSDPPPGGSVPVGRTTLTLWFGERVNVAASAFDLHTPEGLTVPTTVRATGGDEVVELTTEPLAEGTYVLDWHALSLEDGHSSSGTVVFGAGVRPAAVATDDSGLPVGLALLRWLDLSALLLALGCLTVGGRVLAAAGPVRGERLRARARLLALLASVAVVYGGVVTPFLRTRQPGTPWDTWSDQTWVTLSHTQWGRWWLLREVALVVAAVAAVRWGGAGRERARARTVALGALSVAVVLESLGGHASALPGGPGPSSALALTMATAHVIAAGVWVGGLALLALTLRPPAEVAGTRAVWRAFSPRAAVASAVLVATGLYQAGLHVPGFGSLVHGVYGLTVTAKLVLVLVALAVAGLNTLVVNPRLAAVVASRAGGWAARRSLDGRFTRTVALELGVLVLAVAAAALLTATPTSREQAEATRPSTPHAENVDGLFVTSEAVRSGPLSTRLIVRIRPTTLPEPAPVTGVDVLLTGPRGEEKVTLEEVEPGRFEGGASGEAPGAWTSEVRVHRPGLVDAVTHASWLVRPATVDGSGTLRLVTAGPSALLLGGLGVVLLRRRRGGEQPATSDPATDHRQLEESLR